MLVSWKETLLSQPKKNVSGKALLHRGQNISTVADGRIANHAFLTQKTLVSGVKNAE